MYDLTAHPDLVRPLVAERHETLRRQAYVARLRREARVEATLRRRLRRAERRLQRAERRLRRPQLVAPPPALAD